MKTYVRSILAALAALALLAASAQAQRVNPNVTWKVLTPTVKGAPGKTVEVKIQATIAAGSHMYTTKTYPDTALAPLSTEVSAGEKSLVALAGGVKGPKPIRHHDEAFDLETEYWEGAPTLTIPLRISKKAQPGKQEAWVNFFFQTCNASTCIPGTNAKLTFTLEVAKDSIATHDSSAGAELVIPADTTNKHHAADTASTATAPAQKDTTHPISRARVAPASPSAPQSGSVEELDEAQKKGLLAFIVVAAVNALIALGTPCVFPMIPITVSFFTKREHGSKLGALRDASLYALGIITTFCGLGLIVTLVFGATGIHTFATNPFVNITIAIVFMTLALNLFGLFEIQIPTGLVNRLQRKAGNKGAGGVIVMGLIFSLTSFTCTVPFIGNIFVRAASGDYFWPIVGTAAFALVFCIPFFFLALFPTMLKSMPKSGGWLNAVKVVMGFIEIAFAIKYVAGADMEWKWNVFTHEVCLAIWIAVAVLTTMYLLGRFRLPHDTPAEHVGPVRVMFAVAFLSVGFWLLTGLFGANLGEIEAQLPPPRDGVSAARIGSTPATGSEKASAPAEVTWIVDNYDSALAVARKQGKNIFIDFTGYNCTNCRLMERNMFPKPEVIGAMNNFVLVRLYTDGQDPINEKNLKMEVDRFKTFAIPYYAIYTPEDRLIASFPGMTRKQEDFMTFLKKGLATQPVPLASNTP
ncbi:MAG TPA: cytochrome c biogenesis protein CcdA [Candidatus Kapabacteria bacterium]|nr:cytochrome c biogenesis protein CcdA [Candidatus Kapabacteria bacterium]